LILRDGIATALLAAALCISASPGRSDEYPTLDVKPLCRGITNQSALQEGLRSVTFDQCLKAEQADRQTMINEWSSFSADDRRHCIAEATMGGESSYTDLLTCLEMARDVRALRKQASAQSAQNDTTKNDTAMNDTTEPKQPRKSKHHRHHHR
jgi:hypothetical protein